jgi:hypothetical protein
MSTGISKYFKGATIQGNSLQLIALASFLLIIAALWLPFGFERTGLQEPWGTHGYFASGRLPELTLKGQLRPFTDYLIFLAYLISPKSHFGFHVLLILIFFIKAVVAYLLMRRLVPWDYALAYLVAILFCIYPASGELFAFRALPAQITNLFFVISVYLLVCYWDKQKFFLLFCIWGVQLVSFGLYESTLPLTIVAPLLLVIIQGGISKKVIIHSTLWLIIPLCWICFVFTMLFLFPSSSYESRALVNFSTYPLYKIKSVAYGIFLLYWRNLFSIWVNAIGRIFHDASFFLFSILVAFFCGWITWLHTWQEKFALKKTHKFYFLIFLIGLLAMFIGFLPFAITQYRLEASRTYLSASFGATLCIAALVRLASWRYKRQSLVIVFCAIFLVAISLISNMQQHESYNEKSIKQKKILAGILNTAPKIVGEDLTLMFIGFPKEDFNNHYLKSALTFLYGKYPPSISEVEFCEEMRKCNFTEKGLLLERESKGEKYSKIIKFSKLIMLEYRKGDFVIVEHFESIYNSGESYKPFKHIDVSAPLPAKAYSVLADFI